MHLSARMRPSNLVIDEPWSNSIWHVFRAKDVLSRMEFSPKIAPDLQSMRFELDREHDERSGHDPEERWR